MLTELHAQNFVPDLKDHLLSRIRCEEFDGGEHAFTDNDRDHIRIIGDRIYHHSTMQVNYTTYKGRRNQDTINARTHADIMLLNPGAYGQDPYWYARVYGIFHAKVKYSGPGPKCGKVLHIPFLWVRWFKHDRSAPGGFSTRRLHRVEFYDSARRGAFGFLDPQLVIRGCHLIPAFNHGKIDEDDIVLTALQGPRAGEDQSDWKLYYVNM